MRASAQYYGHRPDGEGHRQYRSGFDSERDEMSKNEAYRQVEEGRGKYAYRMVLSPGEELHGNELKEWTRDVMQQVEERGGTWTGFVHDDHTEHPHTHVIAWVNDRMEREDFSNMRSEGDRSAELTLETRATMTQDSMEREFAATQIREIREVEKQESRGNGEGDTERGRSAEVGGRKQADRHQSDEMSVSWEV